MTLKEYAMKNKIESEEKESVYANKEMMAALAKATDELNERLEG